MEQESGHFSTYWMWIENITQTSKAPEWSSGMAASGFNRSGWRQAQPWMIVTFLLSTWFSARNKVRFPVCGRVRGLIGRPERLAIELNVPNRWITEHRQWLNMVEQLHQLWQCSCFVCRTSRCPHWIRGFLNAACLPQVDTLCLSCHTLVSTHHSLKRNCWPELVLLVHVHLDLCQQHLSPRHTGASVGGRIVLTLRSREWCDNPRYQQYFNKV